MKTSEGKTYRVELDTQDAGDAAPYRVTPPEQAVLGVALLLVFVLGIKWVSDYEFDE